MGYGGGPLVNKPSPSSAAPAGFLHELLDMTSACEGGVERITLATARLDLKKKIDRYISKALNPSVSNLPEAQSVVHVQ